jgi:hypothetical protein
MKKHGSILAICLIILMLAVLFLVMFTPVIFQGGSAPVSAQVPGIPSLAQSTAALAPAQSTANNYFELIIGGVITTMGTVVALVAIKHTKAIIDRVTRWSKVTDPFYRFRQTIAAGNQLKFPMLI